ncbi:MAG: hypothetical protein Fur0026_02220 [Sideroxydans sp.]
MFFFCVAQAAWAAEPEAVAEDVIYTVQAGDTLGKLARSKLDAPERWRDVAQYNQLADPDRIEPGQVLRLKPLWLKATPALLKVEAVSGEASVNGRLLRVGDTVATGAQVQTAPGGAVRLRVPDGSQLDLQEASRLKVEKIEQRGESAFVSVLRLLAGQLEAFKVKRATGMADMAVNAKNATLGVRGTHFRMRQQGIYTFAEIEEGHVAFEAAKTPQVLALAGGEGSVADGEHAATVIPLLPAPTFPELPAVFDTPYVEWTMPELAGAVNYVGELARDKTFSDRLISVRSEGRDIHLRDLPNGHYWLKLRAVDAQGLQGREGKTDFEVAVPPRKFVMTKVYVSGDKLQLIWVGRRENPSYQVQVAVDQTFARLLLDTKTSDNWIDIPRPRAGRYFLRVRQIDEAGRSSGWDVPMAFDAP